jgi:putative DNA primase/helicase
MRAGDWILAGLAAVFVIPAVLFFWVTLPPGSHPVLREGKHIEALARVHANDDFSAQTGRRSAHAVAQTYPPLHHGRGDASFEFLLCLMAALLAIGTVAWFLPPLCRGLWGLRYSQRHLVPVAPPAPDDSEVRRLDRAAAFLKTWQPGKAWVLDDGKTVAVIEAEDKAREWLARRMKMGKPVSLLLADVSDDFRSGSATLEPENLARARHVAVKVLGGDPGTLVDIAASLPPATLQLQTHDGVILVWRLQGAHTWGMIERMAQGLGEVMGAEPVMWLPVPGAAKGTSVVEVHTRHIYDIWQFAEAIHARMQRQPVQPPVQDAAADDAASRQAPPPDATTAGQPAVEPRGAFKAAAGIKSKDVDWLWPGVIPRSTLTLLAGQPGTGKSQIAISIAAIVSAGGRWPTGEACPIGRAIIMEVEDAGARIRARIEASGGDVSDASCIMIRDNDDGPLDLTRPENVALAAEQARRMGGVDLLVVSPLLAHFPGGSNADEVIRKKLEPLMTWAANTGTAVLAITHPPKGTGAKGISASLDDQFAGADGYRRVARAAFAAMIDMNDPEPILKRKSRLMICAKQNDGRDDFVIRYRIEGATLPSGVNTSRVVWLGEVSGEYQDEGAGLPNGGERNLRDEDKFTPSEWMQIALKDGPRPQAEMLSEGDALGFSQSAIYRHMAKIGAVGMDGPDGVRLWRIPPK